MPTQQTFQRRKLALEFLLILLLWQGMPAHAQEIPSTSPTSERVTEIARLGGVIRDSVPRADGKILAAEGSTLVLFDSGFGTPDLLAHADLQHGEILDLARAISYVLVLAEDGLLVLPDSGDHIPDPVGFSPHSGQSMDVVGEIIAIASQQAGLHLLRLEGSGAITLLSSMALSAPDGTQSSAENVSLSGDGQRAYVATGPSGVIVVNITDPTSPVVVGPLPGISAGEAVISVGPLLAVGSKGTLQLVDPAPGASTVGVFDALSNGRRIVIQDDYAYIADASDGLKIFWLTAPDRPVQIYGESAHPVADLQVVGNLLYAVGSDGLRILDVGNRYHPLELSRTALAGSPRDIELSDERAFVSLGDQGLAIINLTNLSAPQVTARIPLDGSANAALFDEGTLYVAAGEAGITIINAATSGAESIQTTLATPGAALDLARRGNALLVAAGDAGILSFDVTYPQTPALIGALTLDPISSAPNESMHRAEAITISGKRAYVSEGSSFLVVDISFPDRLGRLTRIETESSSIGVSSVYLYSASGSQIAIYDARATAEPIYLRTYHGLSHIAKLSAQGDRIYATSTGSGPDVVAISLLTPDFPVELDNVGEVGYTWRATPNRDDVWVAAGFRGLRRYQVSEGGAFTFTGSYTPINQSAALAIDGSSLVAGGEDGWALLDTASEEAEVLGQSPDQVAVNSVAIDGNMVAAAQGESGIALYERSETGFAIVAHQKTHGPAAAVTLDTQYVYAADAGGLSVFDRRYLLPIVRVSTPSPATGLAVRGSTAYLSLFDGSVAVIDLGDPMGSLTLRRSVSTQRPTSLIRDGDGRIYGIADNLISRFAIQNLDLFGVIEDSTLPIFASDGFFVGELLAAFSPGETVEFYDLSQFDTGVIWRGSLDLRNTAYPAESAAIVDGYGYIALGEGGLSQIDLQAQSSQTPVDADPIYALLLLNNTLFAAGNKLTVWDVTIPEFPVALSTLPLTASARALDVASDGSLYISMENGVTLAAWNGSTLTELGHLTTSPIDHATQIGTRAFLALHRGGLQVVDVANPGQPNALFTYVSSSGQFVQSLLAIDESTLLVSWDAGIDVLSIEGAEEPPHLLEILPTVGREAKGVSLSPDGSLAVLALGAEGVQIFDLSDPQHPIPVGFVDTPGEAYSTAIQESRLAVADGLCGLEVLNISDMAAITKDGHWRGGYLTSIVAAPSAFYAGGGAHLFGLQFDAALPFSSPVISQNPFPLNGATEVPLDIVLDWGPTPDPCSPVAYEVYLGAIQEPPFVGQVNDRPALDVGQLAPSRTYYWHVDTLDDQGARTIGPEWSFTTVSGFFPNGLPPAPPVFIDRIRQNPVIPLGMVVTLLVAAGIGAMTLRMRRIAGEEPSIPGWYSTEPDEEDSPQE